MFPCSPRSTLPIRPRTASPGSGWHTGYLSSQISESLLEMQSSSPKIDFHVMTLSLEIPQWIKTLTSTAGYTSPLEEETSSSIAVFSASTLAFTSPRKATAHRTYPQRSSSFLLCSTHGRCKTAPSECRERNAGGFPSLGTRISRRPFNTLHISTFDDRINIWDFPENCRDEKESMIRQQNLADLYILVAVDAIQKSLKLSEWKEFPSGVT